MSIDEEGGWFSNNISHYIDERFTKKEKGKCHFLGVTLSILGKIIPKRH